MKFNKKRVSLILFYSILMLPFMGIKVFNDQMMNICKIITSLMITFITLKNLKKVKMNSITVISIIMAVYSVLIAFINNTLSLGIFFTIYFLMISIVFIQIELFENKFEFIYALCILHNIIIIANIPSLISQRNLPEYERAFLVGGKNALAIFALPTIFYNYFYSYIKYGKTTLKSIIFIVISIITTLVGGSSTGLIVLLLMLIFMFLNKKIKFNTKIMYIVYGLILLIMLNSNTLLKDTKISYFITETLNKDITFTGRTYIWEKSLNLIKNNIWGYGRGNLMLLTYFYRISECHNMFIQFLIDGGIPMLLIFLIIFFICHKQKKALENSDRLINFTKITIYVFMILGLTESVSYKIDLWYILIILYFLQKTKGERK